MPDQPARQRARRVEQKRHRSALAFTVVTALAERDALVLACETRAGQAQHALTTREGLSLRETVQWCGVEQELNNARRAGCADSRPPRPPRQSTPTSTSSGNHGLRPSQDTRP